MIRRAYPYRNLEREQFDSIVRMLAEGFNASEAGVPLTCTTTP